MLTFRLSAAAWIVLLSCSGSACWTAEGARIIKFYGYDDCIQISNASTEAVLCPAAGGRILKYALHGENVLYLPPGDEGWRWDGKSQSASMNAGRFDVGPEQVVAARPVLWQGAWTGEILGNRKAILRSQPDEATGLQLVRIFELDGTTSRLTCTQRFTNISQRAVETCHWSRTFANGRGVCIVPLSGPEAPSRFPNRYVRYDPPGTLVNLRPEDEHIQRRGDFLVISDHPQQPKLGFDSYVGWLAYLSPQNLLFVKQFPTYPDRVYNEAAGLTISVWYPDREMVELEPIGPRERLLPEQSAEFTETWYLAKQKYVAAHDVDVKAVAAASRSLMLEQ